MKKIKLSSIKPNPVNPRLIKGDAFNKLVKSIKEFPKMMELRPIIVDDENMVLGGNMRFKALKKLKYTEVPEAWIKFITDLTTGQKEEFLIKDNMNYGEWDDLILQSNWNTQKLIEWGVDIEPLVVGEEEEGSTTMVEFNQSTNFVVKCKNTKELKQLQKVLNFKTNKVNYKEFMSAIS